MLLYHKVNETFNSIFYIKNYYIFFLKKNISEKYYIFVHIKYYINIIIIYQKIVKLLNFYYKIYFYSYLLNIIMGSY